MKPVSRLHPYLKVLVASLLLLGLLPGAMSLTPSGPAYAQKQPLVSNTPYIAPPSYLSH